MSILDKSIQTIDKSNLFIGRSIAWLALIMVLVMAITVIQRYLFATNLIWESELITYFHSLLFLASAGYTLQTNSHVRVDIFYENFSIRKKALFDLLGTILFLIPVCIAITYFASDFIITSWNIGEKSREYSGLPMLYLLKGSIWLFTFTLFIQAISTIYKSVKILRNS